METVFENTTEGKDKRLEILNKRLMDLDKTRESVNLQFWHKDRHGMGHEKDVERMEEAIAFVEVDRKFHIDLEHQGYLFLVNHRFVIAPLKRKWRVKGKAQWYYYKNPEQFIRKYVFREAV